MAGEQSMNFSYSLPVNIQFGRGKAASVGDEVARLGNKVLLVTGRHSCKASGLLDRCLQLLAKAGVEVELFDCVEANPLTTTIDSGSERLRATGCNVVLGIGGGSVMDAAKGIAFMGRHSGKVTDYLHLPQIEGEAVPLVLMTTTAGTGSEGNCVAVFTNPFTSDKLVFFTPLLFAKTAIVDPELMVTLPPAMIAATGFDALSHNIEALVGRFVQPMSAMMAGQAIRLLAQHLPLVFEDATNIASWEQVCWANTLGGMAIGLSACGLPHAMEHPLSGLHNITHGVGLAALYPALMEFSWRSNLQAFATVARALDLTGETSGMSEIDCARHSIAQVRALIVRLNLAFTLSDLGVKHDEIEWMTRRCCETMQVSIQQNPRLASADEIRALYIACL